MSKKPILVFMGIIFFSSFRLALAGLVINEIMYDLSGSDSTNSKSREWIEIYNPDSSEVSIDASKWRIYDGSANRTINGEVNFSIPGNSFVIFAGDKDTFLADHTGFSGTVYDTGITSLNNTGDTLKILDQDLNTIDSVTYASTQGAAGDGNSLQKISSSWTGATPTPGVVNENTNTPPTGTVSGSGTAVSGGSSSTSASSTSATTESKPKVVETPKIKTQITAKSLGFVGLPLAFQALTLGSSGEVLRSGKYFWNFGDGDSKEEQLTYSQLFTHTYFYPGEYTVSLYYYQNPYSDLPEATSQIIINIVSADVSISRVGEAQDFFIELTNNTDYNADISNWLLVSNQKVFTIPKNTILTPKKKMMISPKFTNFSIQDKDSLKLLTAQKATAFEYSSVIPNVIAKNNTSPKIAFNGGKEKKEVKVNLGVASNSISENLPALALSGSELEENSKVSASAPIIPIAALVFIGASAGAVYFIRQKKVTAGKGDDFEILDE